MCNACKKLASTGFLYLALLFSSILDWKKQKFLFLNSESVSCKHMMCWKFTREIRCLTGLYPTCISAFVCVWNKCGLSRILVLQAYTGSISYHYHTSIAAWRTNGYNKLLLRTKNIKVIGLLVPCWCHVRLAGCSLNFLLMHANTKRMWGFPCIHVGVGVFFYTAILCEYASYLHQIMIRLGC